jgi:flagellar protein FlbD
MITLTQLNGIPFSLNEQLIEIIENIPETKISLTNGRYYLVKESREDIAKQIVDYQRRIFKHLIAPQEQEEQSAE